MPKRKQTALGDLIEEVRVSAGGRYARVSQLAELGMRVQDAVRLTGGLPRQRDKKEKAPRKPRATAPEQGTL